MCEVRRMDINCWQSCSGSEKGHLKLTIHNSSLSVHFNGHFPGEPGLTGVY